MDEQSKAESDLFKPTGFGANKPQFSSSPQIKQLNKLPVKATDQEDSYMGNFFGNKAEGENSNFIAPGIPDIRTRFGGKSDTVSSKTDQLKYSIEDLRSVDPHGYEPVYRSRHTIQKRLGRNKSKDLLHEQKSQGRWDDKTVTSKSRYQDFTVESMTEQESPKTRPRDEPRRNQITRKASRPDFSNRSVVEGADEASNIVLLFRVIGGYYQNLSMTVRRVLLSMGSKVDRQRDLQLRRQLAGLENVLAQNPNTEQLDSQIRLMDVFNLVQVVVIVVAIFYILSYFFK